MSRAWLQRGSGRIVARLELAGDAPATVEHEGATWYRAVTLSALDAVIYQQRPPAADSFSDSERQPVRRWLRPRRDGPV